MTYMINLIIIYDAVNIFSMKNYESLRKLTVGVNRYTGVNWSTTTTASRHKLAAVISWPPSPNLEIATNLKADCNRKWSIIITFMLLIHFKHCTKTYLSVWPN